MYFPISTWLPAFLLTLAVETPIVVAVLRALDGPREPRFAMLRLLVVILVANLATHLAVWYVLTQLLSIGTWTYLFVAETWAVVVEAALYWAAIRGLPLLRALAVALVANAASFAIGRLVS